MKKITPAKLREQAKELLEKAKKIEAEYFEELGRVFYNHLKRDKDMKDIDTLKENIKKILKCLG